jgi:hypothetical protein
MKKIPAVVGSVFGILRAGLLAFALLGCSKENPTSGAPRLAKPLIWGGQAVASGDSVFLGRTVSLLGASGFPFCTGALIAENAILTAAHCFPYGAAGFLSVSFNVRPHGSLDPDSNRETSEKKPLRKATQFVLHPQHNSNFDNAYLTQEPLAPLNDLAIVFLDEPAPGNALPFQLPEVDSEIHPGSSIAMAGFGLSNAQGGDYGTLYRVDSIVGVLRPRALEFVDGPFGTKGSCRGDSGGPVVLQQNLGAPQERPLLIGLISYGPLECAAGIGVNTDLRHFRTWIETTLRQGDGIERED